MKSKISLAIVLVTFGFWNASLARAAIAPLPDTSENIHLGQVFNYNIPNHDYDSEVGKTDIVWGAERPSPSSVYNLAYYPFERDRGNGSHNLAWFMAYHPDWIEYTCAAATTSQTVANRNGYLAYEFNDTNVVPLDIANPAVRQWMFDTYLSPWIASGYQGIAFDNVSLRNAFRRCGHYDLSGNFVQQYTGDTMTDPHYAADVLAWGKWAQKALHDINAAVAMNYAYDQYASSIEERRLIGYMDVQLPEGGASGPNGTTLTNWQNYTNFEQYVQSQGVAVFIAEYFNQGPWGNTTAHQEWTLANYLLIKGSHTYFSLSDEESSSFATLNWIVPAYSSDVGHPISPPGSSSTAMYSSQGVYIRDYSNGKAVVNPSLTTATVSLTGSYTNAFSGAAVSSPLTMRPQSGIVLRNRRRIQENPGTGIGTD